MLCMAFLVLALVFLIPCFVFFHKYSSILINILEYSYKNIGDVFKKNGWENGSIGANVKSCGAKCSEKNKKIAFINC
jgi:hypothetical protein